MVIMNILIGADDLDQKLQTLANLVEKLKSTPIFMKFGTQNKSNMLIMNIMIGIDDPEAPN